MSQEPILVTGSHRSGSTWVGRTLARSATVTYINEPFHPRSQAGVCRTRPAHWYEYVCSENENQRGWRDSLGKTLSLKYDLGAGARAIRVPRDVGRLCRDWSVFTLSRLTGGRALLKDPIAFFSTPWIADRFDARVIVLTRHPAAFASSLVRLNWTFDFTHWLNQPLLMRDLLSPFRNELEMAVTENLDTVAQASLCWKIIASVTKKWEEEHPEWMFRTHEELSRDPVSEFEDLFAFAGLKYENHIQSAIVRNTRKGNPAEAPSGHADALRRDSRANVKNWKHRLDPSQVARIRDSVGEIAEHFFDEHSWAD